MKMIYTIIKEYLTLSSSSESTKLNEFGGFFFWIEEGLEGDKKRRFPNLLNSPVLQ